MGATRSGFLSSAVIYNTDRHNEANMVFIIQWKKEYMYTSDKGFYRGLKTRSKQTKAHKIKNDYNQTTFLWLLCRDVLATADKKENGSSCP